MEHGIITNLEIPKEPPKKLSIPDQIQHMKKKGVNFSICTEAEAENFLSTHNYYYKIKAYAHNFDTYRESEKRGQYINLDFAQLKDLSTIDAHFRKIILTMCVDLEHFLKVKMLNDCTMVDEDGYEIVQELFIRNPKLEEDVEKAKVNTSTSHSIAEKCHGQWAIWNVVELLSFGPFVQLYKLFYERNATFKDTGIEYLYPVRMIRNAAAHNNCLLNQMRAPYSRTIKPSYDLRNRIIKISSVRAETAKAHLQHPTIHDFLALIILYDRVVPEPTRSKGLQEVSELFHKRMVRNKEYYKKEQSLMASYRFVLKILDKVTKNSD